MTTISQERQRLADVGMRLIRRETWGSRYDYRNTRTVQTATKQFVHVSVTQPSAYNSHAAHVRAIENIGILRFPATGISYNRVILFGVDTAYEAQPMGRRGAHTVNDFRLSTCTRWGSQCPGRGKSLTAPSWNLNYNARAYVYGALCEASATDSVVDTFAQVMAADRRAGLVTMDASIHGHRCVSAKSCPCGMWPRMHDLAGRVDNYLEDDVTPEQMRAELTRFFNGTVGDYLDDKPMSRDQALTRAARFSGSNTNRLRYEVLPALAALRAEHSGDPAAIAAELAPLVIPPVVAAVGAAGGLTAEQVEEAAEKALRDVLGSLDA